MKKFVYIVTIAVALNSVTLAKDINLKKKVEEILNSSGYQATIACIKAEETNKVAFKLIDETKNESHKVKKILGGKQ